jgi:hypothetical protein
VEYAEVTFYANYYVVTLHVGDMEEVLSKEQWLTDAITIAARYGRENNVGVLFKGFAILEELDNIRRTYEEEYY